MICEGCTRRSIEVIDMSSVSMVNVDHYTNDPPHEPEGVSEIQ